MKAVTKASVQGQWQQVGARLTAWLLIEVLLNLVGLDTLADYSEYVFAQDQSHPKKTLCRCVTLYKQYPAG